MLRTLFVLSIAAFGTAHALRSPFYTLLLYLWIAYFRPETWVWGTFVASLNLSLIAGALLLGYSIVSGSRLKFDFRRGLLFALLGHSLVSTLLSDYYTYSWPYWLEFGKSTVVTYLISCLVTDAAKFRLTLMVIVASLGFEATKQGWLQLVLNPGGQNMNDHPFLGDNNGVGLGILMLVPLITALGRTATSAWERRLYSFVTIGAAYRAISTYSRGAFVSGGVLVASYFLRSQSKFRTAAAIVITCSVILPVLPDAFWNRMDTIAVSEDSLEEDDSSARGRYHFWRVAVVMANANPIFGTGHNSFTQGYDKYDFLKGQFGRHRATHSSWFATLAELGYVGALIFGLNVLLALCAAVRVRRAARNGHIPKELGVFATALEASFLVFITGATFLSFQYTEILWHFVGLSIALTTIASNARGTAGDAVPRSKPEEPPETSRQSPVQVREGMARRTRSA